MIAIPIALFVLFILFGVVLLFEIVVAIVSYVTYCRSKDQRINEKIGETVQGYSAAGLQWQVFYSDPIETYLISKTIAKSNFVISLKRTKQSEDEEEYEYNGSEDVRNFSYGTKWNKMWLKKCLNNESTYDSAKATAYMCDPQNWKEYEVDTANYAAGGPTLELFIASWNKSQRKDVKLLEDEVTQIGILQQIPSGLRDNDPLKTNICKSVYNLGKNYWVVSPSSQNNYSLKYVKNTGRINNNAYTEKFNVRPIVSIPTSKISVNGDVVSVNP